MSANIVFFGVLLLFGNVRSFAGNSHIATQSHTRNSGVMSMEEGLHAVENAQQVARNSISHSKNVSAITKREETNTSSDNLHNAKQYIRDSENMIAKRENIDSSLSSAFNEFQPKGNQQTDLSLSSAFNDFQPDGNPKTVQLDSAKKFHISQKLVDKLSALKLSGKNEVINLPGAVHVYGPPPKSLTGIPQAEEPLNVVATPHLTKFHSFHKLNLMPLKFNGQIRPVHLYTNKRPMEINTGRTQHLFLPFTQKNERYRSHALSGFFKTVPAEFLVSRPRVMLQSNYIERQPVLRERTHFNKLYGNPMQEFRPQIYKEETPYGRQELPARGELESSPQTLQIAPEMSESAFIRNASPRIVEGGAPVEKFMPGRELTLGSNEDIDLAHLNLKDGNIQTVPTSPDPPPGLISENGLSNSPGVELLNIHPQQAPGGELTNHQLEETPNTIRSPDMVESSVARDSTTIDGEQFRQHEGERVTQNAGSFGLEGALSSSTTPPINGEAQGSVHNVELNFGGGDHHQYHHYCK